jgi:aspartate racemase
MSFTIGIVGGLGPEGTMHYYKKLIKSFAGGTDRPGIIIDHVWMDRFVTLIRTGTEREIAELFLEALSRLQCAGCDIALVAAVTPHKFLSKMRAKFPLPVIDIVDATRQTLSAAGYKKVGLLGTRLTLTDGFFLEPLEIAGMRVEIPDEAGIEYLDKLIFGDLATGWKTEEMRREIAAIVGRMTQRTEMDCLVVACTDLFDLLDTDVPLIDPIDCHIRIAREYGSDHKSTELLATK